MVSFNILQRSRFLCGQFFFDFSKRKKRSVINTRHFAYVQMSAAEGIGPVDALSDALR